MRDSDNLYAPTAKRRRYDFPNSSTSPNISNPSMPSYPHHNNDNTTQSQDANNARNGPPNFLLSSPHLPPVSSMSLAPNNSLYCPNNNPNNNNPSIDYDPQQFHQSRQTRPVDNRSPLPTSIHHHQQQQQSHHQQYVPPHNIPHVANGINHTNSNRLPAGSSIQSLISPHIAPASNNGPSSRRGAFGTFGPNITPNNNNNNNLSNGPTHSASQLPPLTPMSPHHRPSRPTSGNPYHTSQSPYASLETPTNNSNNNNTNTITRNHQPPPPLHPPPSSIPNFRTQTRDFANTHKRSGGPNNHNNSMTRPTTPSNNNNRSILSIRSMVPVKEALAEIRDSSPVIQALVQTILQKNGTNHLSNSQQRNVILDFTGFPQNKHVSNCYLASLSRSDADLVAWMFVVSKQGKREDIATRVIESLRAPLHYRVPTVGKKPHITYMMDIRPISSSLSNLNNNSGRKDTPSMSTRSSVARARTVQTVPPIANNNANTTNPNSNSDRNDAMMHSLTQQLDPDSSNGVTPDYVTVSSLPMATNHNRLISANSNNNTSTSSKQNMHLSGLTKGKQVQTACLEVLRGYDFKQGENPFNEPLNEPLGEEVNRFVYFSSAQLSRGSDDPVLKFHTPAPLTTKDNDRIKGGDVQIHLRCLRVESEKPREEWKQAWPFPAQCRVNSHPVNLNQAQRYTNGKLAGRDSATNITPFLRKYVASSSSTSNIHSLPTRSLNKVSLKRQVSSASPTWGQYVLFAQEVLVYTHETMMENVEEASEKYWKEYRKQQEQRGELSKNISDFEMARIGVTQFLSDSDGITLSSMKVSLRCPLALVRINTPVKGRKCQHVQCFDLSSFLEYSRRSSKFECPVCNKATAKPEYLVKSPYIQHALKEFKDCDEVEILKDGSMVPVERKQTGVASDDEDEQNNNTASGGNSNANGAGSGNVQNGTNDSRNGSTSTYNTNVRVSEVVDLTLDSDDDDNIPAINNNVGIGTQLQSTPPLQQQGIQMDQDDIDFTFNADIRQFGSDHTQHAQANHPIASSSLQHQPQLHQSQLHQPQQPQQTYQNMNHYQPPQHSPYRVTTNIHTNVNNNRSNLPIDIIAIDSDSD